MQTELFLPGKGKGYFFWVEVCTHAKTVLLVMLVHVPIRSSLLWHAISESSVPLQLTDARATGRFSKSTCAAWHR
jgi:hypothetical protein